MTKITASQGESTRTKVTQGSHDAMLIRVIDLGTQTPPPTSQFPDPKRQIELVYEVLDQTMEYNGETKPMLVYERVSPYVSYKVDKITNYHKKVNALTGKTLTHDEAKVVDYASLLGNVYTVQIEHKGEYENIQSMTKATKKTQESYAEYIPHNEMFVFSLEEFNADVFAKLHEKKREVIAKSPEYKSAIESADEKEVDDLPF